jgi:DNA repair exonuclease SbcCD ATPase subunit
MPLKRVMLKTAGRMLCVISHVPELRERIAARLEIKPTQQGISIRAT